MSACELVNRTAHQDVRPDDEAGREHSKSLKQRNARRKLYWYTHILLGLQFGFTRGHQRFFSAAKRLANISKSSSGGAGLVPSFEGCVREGSSSSVGGSSGSFGVLAPVLLASADIVAASGRGESNAVAIFSDCSRR